MHDISALVNRLGKNLRHRIKWARRQNTNAWRAYDRDIPQFPLAIDIYAEHVHVQEYDTGWKLSDAEHAAWRRRVSEAIAFVTGFSLQHIHFKERRRQRGLAQYEKFAAPGEDFIVEEHGRRFWVNLDTYLDTGLFLDHRNTRQRVGELASGARFLNLFAYTGSFTVYAATGGAPSSDTVDLSNTYCQWAARNFALNSVDESAHRIHRADVRAWLAAAAGPYDLIVMDPPSFSNSKKTPETLDIQRDHAALITAAMRVLAPQGRLFFSTNLRSFVLDEALRARFCVSDITHQSIPEDFARTRIHQCFEIRR